MAVEQRAVSFGQWYYIKLIYDHSNIYFQYDNLEDMALYARFSRNSIIIKWILGLIQQSVNTDVIHWSDRNFITTSEEYDQWWDQVTDHQKHYAVSSTPLN